MYALGSPQETEKPVASIAVDMRSRYEGELVNSRVLEEFGVVMVVIEPCSTCIVPILESYKLNQLSSNYKSPDGQNHAALFSSDISRPGSVGIDPRDSEHDIRLYTCFLIEG